ncbi:MAG: protein kinase [Bryobacterales bacterium]|nr:protein kinase [Acidobacteriota bacterium]MCB9385091.1 protein kinase [Bryobacterales bacterium]
MVGRVISHYRVLEKLGEGGMGVVYKAEDLKLRREVALKFLRERMLGDDERKRFFREAQAAAALQHPNICTIFEVDEVDGQVFFAMALVEGRTLADMLAAGPLEFDEAVDIAIQLADALAAAHNRGVVHRDIKAGNVIVTADGRAVVLDFGLAQMGGESRITRTGATVGTAAYMSPEQAKGSDMDQRTDIWSLGVLLYEMIAGRRPFRGQYELAVMYNIVHEPPEPLRDVVPDASPELERVLDRALRKNIEERYPSARELSRDLRALRGRYSSPDYSAASQPTVLAPAVRPRRLSRSMVLAAIVAAITLLGGAATWYRVRDRSASSLFAAIPSNKHLAVLPFENIGQDSSSQALCDGLVETLTGKLTELQQFEGGLMVVPASEVRAEGVSSASRAAAMFGVNLAITGSVQPANGRLRLTANLVDASTLRQLRSTTLDVSPSDSDGLQDGIVRRVVEMLEIELNVRASEALSAGGTSRPRAYQRYLQGKGYLQRFDQEGNVDLAIESLEHAVEDDPSYAPANAELSEAYWQKFNETSNREWVEKSLSAAEAAAKKNPRLALVRVRLGEAYRRTGRLDDAIAEFQAALTQDPLNSEARSGLARVYSDQGRLEEAEALHKQAVELQPNQWAAYSALGVFYSNTGRPEKAIQAFDRVIELTPDNPLNYRNLAGALIRDGEYDRARAMLQRSIEIEPSGLAYANLGAIEFFQGHYDRAAAAFQDGIAMSPSSNILWFNLAESLRWQAGRDSEARSAYRKAIELAEARVKARPDDVAALSRIARSYAKLGDHRMAQAALNLIPAAARDSSAAMFATVVVDELAGKRRQALASVAQAMRAGLWSREWDDDPELESLREDNRYKSLTAKQR